ncbi:putative oxidoreductase [Polyplosphaeria fusca]|uniref:Oxidoreductase n=1 Tax=Polyplosphaeria fusca TaxID=682080 RepID=A0A9P4QT75_9PLEO|nr:putative oxidoreductase [Polyplosphaeria fusca]
MVAIEGVERFCCLALSISLPGQVWFPGNETYVTSLASYFSAQQSSIQPQCIVSPKTAEDISLIMHTISSRISSNNTCPSDCKFAIRSGGHASLIGASNIPDGLTIDLRALNSIQISQDQSLVTVGAGAVWDDVYSRLHHVNRSVAGPRSAGIGVGGVAIGGGISFFGPRYGWTSDAVTDFEVALYNGSIVNANSDTNSDLLWALRGGSNNFGIVTHVTMQAFEQRDLWGGYIFHESSTADAQIAAFFYFNNATTYDEFASLISTFSYSAAGGFNIVNSLEYTKAVSNPPIFRKFMDIPYFGSTLRITNMTDLLSETAKLQPNGLREASATLTIEPTVEALKATVDAWNNSVSFVQDVPGIVWSLSLDPLPPAMYARHAKTNALGLTGRNAKALVIMMISATWSSSDDDGVVESSIKALVKKVTEATRRLGALDRYQYINYAAQWQGSINSYGRNNVNKLRKIRSKYDPAAVFTDWVPGGFKIPESE